MRNFLKRITSTIPTSFTAMKLLYGCSYSNSNKIQYELFCVVMHHCNSYICLKPLKSKFLLIRENEMFKIAYEIVKLQSEQI